MTKPNQQRHKNMQAQMTVSLNKLRAKVAAQMIETLERIDKRPRISGDDELPTLAADNRLHKDESGSIVIGAAIGVPGLSQTAETMMDVGSELYDQRGRLKMQMERPQDLEVLSVKQEAFIREQNQRDLMAYLSLGEKLDLLDTYVRSGYSKGALIGDTILPIEKGPEPEYKPYEYNAYKPEDPKADNDKVSFKVPALKAS